MAGGTEKGVSVILYISENKNRKAARKNVMIYVGVALFCIVFFLIYDRFSHGVRSPYMTFLFAWPLTLGVIPELVFYLLPGARRPGTLSANLYHSGVAALTTGSLLRGIFDIAGNASVYQHWLMVAGGFCLQEVLSCIC